MKLYAVWEAKVFRVSFVTKTDEITIPDQHVKWGKEATDPRTTGTEMVRDGFVFRFFSLSANGSSGEYQFSNKVYEETSIYAVWKARVRMKSGGDHTLFTKGDKLYAHGQNINGDLGLGDTTDRNIPTLIDSTTYGNKKIKELILGTHHSIILTTDNSLYVWGWNRDGQLGLGDTENRLTPTLMPASYYGNKQIKKVLTNGYNTFILTTDGSLYAFGYNEFGQLGLGDTENRLTPTLIPKSSYDNKEIKEFYPGKYQSFILTTDGSLYAFGLNNFGQLGLGDLENRLTPTLMPKSSYDNKEIKEVKGDVSSSGILTKDGSLYVFGQNNYGQLGLGDNTNRLVPTLLPASYYGNKTIKQFELYYYCLSILTTDNSLYTTGKNDNGALGLGDTNHRSTPTLVDSSTYENKIIRELCSGDEKLTLITTDEKVYSCGINNSGQLGNGHNNMVTSLALNTIIDNL